MKVLGKRIVVERPIEETVTKGGIYIPDSAKKLSQKAQVKFIGDVDDIKVEDIVYFSRFSGTELKIKDKEYLVLNEEDLLIVDNEDGRER